MRRSWPLIAFILPPLAGAGAAHAADGFEKVRCDRPIIPALIGARSANERVVIIEARRRALGLKDLGAQEVSDGVDTIHWRICGREFELIMVRNVTRDAIEWPAHSREAPGFASNFCEAQGKRIAGDIEGVFDHAPAAGETMAPARFAWSLDHKKWKYSALPPDAMCPTDAINAEDQPH